MAVSDRKMEPLTLTQVRITGGFWKGRLDTNRAKTIPHIYRMLEQTDRLDALRKPYRPGDPDTPHIFWDSDIAKWVEAASCSLATHRVRKGYATLRRAWNDGDTVTLTLAMPDEARLTARFMPRVLGGCVVINGAGLAPSPSGWKEALYRRAEAVGPPRTTKIRAIPYALWDNRKAGPMTVWMPRA